MTLAEIEDSSPNGFHDAEIRQLSVDFIKQTANFRILVWVGERREAYRTGDLTLSGLQLFTLESPTTAVLLDGSPITIDAGVESISDDFCRQNLGAELLSKLPPGAFVRSYFVFSFNCFMHVSALSAQVAWGEITYR